MKAVAGRQDREAFASLCRHYAPRVRAFLRSRLPAAEADEVAQDVMLRVWTRAGRYDPNKAAVSTWIFTIARNAAVDRHRKHRHIAVDPQDATLVTDDSGKAAESATRRVDRSWAVEALAVLPPAQADAMRAVYLEERSMPEVADAHGIPVGTLKSRVRLAMATLRKQLERRRA